jgi:hypothetical protein
MDEDEDELNGREKAAAQEARGTRPLVCELDALRLLCGFDRVEVLTPLVETRLRSGLLPPRPLKLRVELGSVAENVTHCVELVLRIGYPSTPVEAELADLASQDGSSSGNTGNSISCSGGIDGCGVRASLAAALLECVVRGDGAVTLVRSMLSAMKSLEVEESKQALCIEGGTVEGVVVEGHGRHAGHLRHEGCEGQRWGSEAEVDGVAGGGVEGGSTSNTSSGGLVPAPLSVLHRVEALASQTEEISCADADVYAGAGAPVGGSFNCRVCRHKLFTSDALHEHSQPLLRQLGASTSSGIGSVTLSIASTTVGPRSCTSLFLEEAPEGLDPSSANSSAGISTINSASNSISTSNSTNASNSTSNSNSGKGEEAVSDKLYCGKCASRVGSWSWAGARCSCGQWVVPSFQFTSSKVDAKLT